MSRLTIQVDKKQTVQLSINVKELWEKIKDNPNDELGIISVHDFLVFLDELKIEFRTEHNTNIRFDAPRWIKIERKHTSESGL